MISSIASHRPHIAEGRPIGASLLPGLALCGAVAAGAYGTQRVEVDLLGHPWLEPLVLAILLGAAIRSAWTPGSQFFAGIAFSAKILLEIAVVLLGLSISTKMLEAVGISMILGIAAVVGVAIAGSYLTGRLLRLPPRLALLVACGNSICGNSAIAAVAPVIGADGEEVAASIAFTAVLGVAVVLALPLLGLALGLGGIQYGALAGLTVYAVPQVIAAAAPLGAIAIQMGTVVKLVRVLMLGPVCLLLSLITPRLREEPDELPPHVTAGDRPASPRLPIHHLVPWFIIGFLALMTLRSLGAVPLIIIEPAATAATILTVISMAALGLGVDVRTVAHSGGRVVTSAMLSLLLLGLLSLILIHLVRLP